MDALADLDLDQITDPIARRVIPVLLNLVEDLQAENERLRAENQHLRDELARLQGGSGRPTIRPQVGRAGVADHSSERERRVPTPRQPRSKVAELVRRWPSIPRSCRPMRCSRGMRRSSSKTC
jgi:regulator of replication initiation timing